jgi:hypothetical protein
MKSGDPNNRLRDSSEFFIGLVLAGLAFLFSKHYFLLPSGSEIRDMGGPLMVLLLAVIGIPFAAWNSLLISKKRIGRIHLISIGLCLSPIPIYILSAIIGFHYRGIIPKP